MLVGINRLVYSANLQVFFSAQQSLGFTLENKSSCVGEKAVLIREVKGGLQKNLSVCTKTTD